MTWSAPEYPERARLRGIEGDVFVEADVHADGSVASVRVLRSSGSALLDRAATAAVLEWTFEPVEPVEPVEHAADDRVRGPDGAPDAGRAVVTVELPAIRFRLVKNGSKP